MKKKNKKLLFSALTISFLLPLASMAASGSFSLPQEKGKSIQYRQASTESFNHSSLVRNDRISQRDSRRIENRARHEEMLNVLKSGDYNAWLEFVEGRNCSMISQLNEDNFSEFVQMHIERAESRNSRAMDKNIKNQKNLSLKR